MTFEVTYQIDDAACEASVACGLAVTHFSAPTVAGLMAKVAAHVEKTLADAGLSPR